MLDYGFVQSSPICKAPGHMDLHITKVVNMLVYQDNGNNPDNRALPLRKSGSEVILHDHKVVLALTKEPVWVDVKWDEAIVVEDQAGATRPLQPFLETTTVELHRYFNILIMAITSPFSSEQQEVLKTYLPGYLAKDSNSRRSQYHKEIVNEILERAEFKHKLLLSIKSMGDWKTAARLFQILSHDTIDGKTFFRNEKDAEIQKHAATLEGESSACFKKALTALWNAETNQAGYNMEAQNFGTSLYGSFESGALEGHWDPNTPDFADKYKEDYDSLLAVWRKYGGEFCPRTVPAGTGDRKYTITLDADKRLCFPDAVPEDVPIQVLQNLLSSYLKSLWHMSLFQVTMTGSHCISTEYSGRCLPLYIDLETSPETFIDIERFKNSTLQDPLNKSLKGSAIFALAEFFAEHGAMSVSSPFEFCKHSDTDSSAITADC
ncbi:hypothetical protein C8R42DRAFT_724405 [Lentinula raphanica]|nr:hypothetical protein C8R42DRAFT_724405 [Lentinula raphanica]